MDTDEIEINVECYDSDIDDIAFEPETVESDNNEELAEKFGY